MPNISKILRFLDWIGGFPSAILGLIIRLGIADVFWRSGQTKVDGWHVTDTTVQLFRDEYKVPLLSPEVAATLAAVQEHLFLFSPDYRTCVAIVRARAFRYDGSNRAFRISVELARSSALGRLPSLRDYPRPRRDLDKTG